MAAEQIIREILRELQRDTELCRMVAEGVDPDSLSSGDLVALANLLVSMTKEPK